MKKKATTKRAKRTGATAKDAKRSPVKPDVATTAKGTRTKAARGNARDLPADPNRCATPRCKGEPVMTHLGKPLCQKCWDRHCADDAGATAKSKANPTAEAATDQPSADDGNAKKKRGSNKQTSPAKTKEAKPKRISALDAAAQVLAKADAPMRAQDLVTAMAEQGLWTSPGGKTPHATLYAAMIREISAKGDDARFKKVERGQFEFNAKAKA